MDTKMGNGHYGFRYYNPETGRWLNRDPIDEGGFKGVFLFLSEDSQLNDLSHCVSLTNPYAFVNNKPVFVFDLFGLYEVNFEIITEIKRTQEGVPSLALGIKTEQWVTVETDDGSIVDSGNYTADTFGFIPALSDFFEDSWKKSAGGDCRVFVTMSGWAQNLANPLLGAINWDFEFVIDVPANRVFIKSGKHDGFPSYRVFYGPGFYEFDEISPDLLADPMDITFP